MERVESAEDCGPMQGVKVKSLKNTNTTIVVGPVSVLGESPPLVSTGPDYTGATSDWMKGATCQHEEEKSHHPIGLKNNS